MEWSDLHEVLGIITQLKPDTYGNYLLIGKQAQ